MEKSGQQSCKRAWVVRLPTVSEDGVAERAATPLESHGLYDWTVRELRAFESVGEICATYYKPELGGKALAVDRSRQEAAYGVGGI